MTLLLNEQQQTEIYNKIKKLYSDFFYFDSALGDGVKRLIFDSTHVQINTQFVLSLNQNYIPNMESYQSKDQLELLEKMKIILMTTTVYLFSLAPSSSVFLFSSTEELLKEYPQWNEQLNLEKEEDRKELNWLLQFRNFMKLALLLVPARNNKIFLLRVVERLEGSNIEYITGTGQRPAVTRRATDIFHHESGLQMVKKTSTKRSRAAKEFEENSVEVKEEGVVLKKAKSIRTPAKSKQSLPITKTLPIASVKLVSEASSTSKRSMRSQRVVSFSNPPLVKTTSLPSDDESIDSHFTHDTSTPTYPAKSRAFENYHPTSSSSFDEAELDLFPLDELELDLDESAYSMLLGEDYNGSFTEAIHSCGI